MFFNFPIVPSLKVYKKVSDFCILILYPERLGLPDGLAVNPPVMILGSGRSPGGGHGNPLQYSCLENLMDKGVWWVTVHWVVQSQTDWTYKHVSWKNAIIIYSVQGFCCCWFFVNFLGLCYLQTKTVLFLLSQYIYFFFFCLVLLNLLELPVQCWIKVVRGKYLSLVLNHREKGSIFSSLCMICCRLSTLLFIKVRKFLSILNHWGFLLWLDVGFWQVLLLNLFIIDQTLFLLYHVIRWFFFPLTYWCTDYIIWFLNVELAWILGINLSVMVYIFIYIRFDVMIFCWQVLHLCSWDTLVCSFPFL